MMELKFQHVDIKILIKYFIQSILTTIEVTIGTLLLTVQHLCDLRDVMPRHWPPKLPNPLTCNQGFPGASSSTSKTVGLHDVV